MRRLGLIVFLLVLVLTGSVIGVLQTRYGKIYLPSGVGITAKQICSLHFVSGLEPERARALYTDPLLGGARSLVTVDVDAAEKTVRASVLGFAFHVHAQFREGLGCTLVHGAETYDPDLALPDGGQSELMALDAAHRDEHFDPDALNGAMDAAFTDDGRNTLAVAVLHQGRLIAERYADGVDAHTPLHGWSMSKSLAATYAGVLVHQGLIDIYAPGQVSALSEADPALEDITIDHLLRMTGGLAGHERNNGVDPNSDMLFTESDMAEFAATRERLHPAGAFWEYQSGNTILAGAGLQHVTGDTLEADLTFLRENLFEPLGMYDTVIEADEAGTFKWSSYVYASAQDWARLGQLYLDNGRVGDRQIIPENWYDYVASPTANSNNEYGSGFWINQWGLPADTLVMNGFQSQRTVIVPSHDLIVVRLGASNGVNERTGELVHAIIEAKL